MLLGSCNERQYLTVKPSVRGVNKFGYLSAEVFPLMFVSLLLGLIYFAISLCVGRSVYASRSFASPLHYLFLATVTLDSCYFFLSYYLRREENAGERGTAKAQSVARVVEVATVVVGSAMMSMNALVALLLSVGYQISDKNKSYYRKIVFVIVLYFLNNCLSLAFYDPAATFAKNKHQVLICVFTVGIAAAISFLSQH